MAATTKPYILTEKQQTGVIKYLEYALPSMTKLPFREHFEYIDREYYRENMVDENYLQAMWKLKTGYKSFIPDQTIPIVMPHVETVVTHLSDVFLSSYPIFGVVSSPENMDVAQQMEAIIKENSTRCGWARQLQLFFRDGAKYNRAAVEVDWKEHYYYSADQGTPKSTGAIEPKKLLWEGNEIRRLDPYNTFCDLTVPISEVHSKGEFAGYIEMVSRVRLKEILRDLPTEFTTNARTAFESGLGQNVNYHFPEVNRSSLLAARDFLATNMGGSSSAGIDWDAWVGLTGAKKVISYHNFYELTTLFARIIPSEFAMEIEQRNTPQIWKFIIVNGQVVIYAERMTNAHKYLPTVFSQPVEDGLNYQTKGIAENVIPSQDSASALWNSSLNAKRRAIYDRIFYDPSRVKKEDINVANPIARVPVKSATYGKGVSEAVYIAPQNDTHSAQMIQEARELRQFANELNGLNAPMQGQFQKGNKSRKEWDDTMGRSNGRMQSHALAIEYQTMVPIKHIIRSNIMQYQASGVITPPGGSSAKIDAAALRKSEIQFTLSDGMLPSDKIVPPEMLQAFLQFASAVPAVQAEYDTVGMMAYYCKLGGADWFGSFKRDPQAQQQYLKQLAGAASAAATTPPETPQGA